MGDREWWQNDRDRIDDERRWGEWQLPCKTLKQNSMQVVVGHEHKMSQWWQRTKAKRATVELTLQVFFG